MTVDVGQSGGSRSGVSHVVAPGPAIPSGQDSAASRMSILAVTAVIVGLLACMTCFAGYVFGVVGNVLAISALVLIRRENGRLRGKSLAMVAIGLNSLAFLFGVVFTAGAAQMAKTVARYVTPVEDIQHKDLDKARGAFTGSVAAELTPERFATFDAKVKDQLGAFASVPTKDLIEFIRRAMEGVDKQSAAMNSLPTDSRVNLYSLPMDFEKGRALLIICLDTTDKTPEFALGRIRNLGVLKDGSGEIIWLLPLKDNTPAGLAAPVKRDTAKVDRPESVAKSSSEVVPPPMPPADETKNVLPPP